MGTTPNRRTDTKPTDQTNVTQTKPKDSNKIQKGESANQMCRMGYNISVRLGQKLSRESNIRVFDKTYDSGKALWRTK